MKLTTSPSGHHDTRYAVVKCRLIEAKQTSLGRGAEAEVLRNWCHAELIRHRGGTVSYVGFGTDRRWHCLT